MEGAHAEGAHAEGAKADNDSLFDAILKRIHVGQTTKKTLAVFLNVGKETGSFRRAFAQLLKIGFIERTQANSKAPNQSYRITIKGNSYLGYLKK